LAWGINASGQIVGGYFDGTSHGFALSGGRYTTLDVPGGTFPDAHGINASGQIVGEYHAADRSFGFALSGGIYTTINVPGSSTTRVFGINDAGQIVGEYEDGSGQRGFVLSDGLYTPLDVPGSSETLAFGINASGQIVGTFRGADGFFHGFIATPQEQVIPEPSALTLIGIGTLSLSGYIWRRKGPAQDPINQQTQEPA
jgi:uncharacterized membrane protein